MIPFWSGVGEDKEWEKNGRLSSCNNERVDRSFFSTVHTTTCTTIETFWRPFIVRRKRERCYVESTHDSNLARRLFSEPATAARTRGYVLYITLQCLLVE